MKELKILYGSGADISRDVSRCQMIELGYKKLLEADGECKVTKFSFAFKKDNLNAKIQTGEYNIVITSSSFSAGRDEAGNELKDTIGVASFKIWKKEYPEVRIILVEDEAAKGSTRLFKLYRDVKHYDTLFYKEGFSNRMLMPEIVKIIKNCKTREEAFDEYGLINNPLAVEYEKLQKESEGSGSVAVPEVGDAGENNEVPIEELLKEPVDERSEEETELKAESETEIPGASEEENKAAQESGVGSEVSNSEEEAEKAYVETEQVSDFVNAFMDMDNEETNEPSLEAEEMGAEVLETESVEEKIEATGFGGFDFDNMDFSAVMPEGVREISSERVEVESGPTQEEIEAERRRKAQAESDAYFQAVAESDIAYCEELRRKAREEQTLASSVPTGEKPVEEGFFAENFANVTSEELPKSVASSSDVDGEPETTGNSSGGPEKEILPIKALIKKVMDEDSIMVELMGDLPIEKGTEINEYQLLIMAKGVGKGKVVGGRYVASTITFGAYGTYMVGKHTIMVEVPEFNCVEKKGLIEGRVVNILVIKLS